MAFLKTHGIEGKDLTLKVEDLKPVRLYIGKGDMGLEIAVFSRTSQPGRPLLNKAYKARKGSRAAPVLIAVEHEHGVSLCGASGEQPPIYDCKDVDQARRLCVAALKEPDRNSAIRFLKNAMPSLETPLPGIVNEGLLALHYLQHIADEKHRHSQWEEGASKAKAVLGKTGNNLVDALGFSRKSLDCLTELLLVEDAHSSVSVALAVLLNEGELPEGNSQRFNSFSPISYALTKADKEKLEWVLMIQEDRVRIYNTSNIGVGRRGRTETYVECSLLLLATENLGLLWLLFSSEALRPDGTLKGILEQSKLLAAGVASKLRQRIYEIVVPQLAMGIAKARDLVKPNKEELELTYEMALTVLFRLLFIAYAEDRELLPFKSNEMYRRRALKNKAIELGNVAAENTQESSGSQHWQETSALWNAVYSGNAEWGVPAYGGAIFSSEQGISKAGAELAKIELGNECFREVLHALLLTDTDESENAPVDFRALSVREFGTIYEGLLESKLNLANQDLTLDKKGSYIPAKKKDKIVVAAGEIYLHNRSGSRKATGSFYTPDVLVEHLLKVTLEPAIDKHLKRLDALDNDVDRAEQFFDFRLADISMGSGHFLVSAIDWLERRFALWLESNNVPGVKADLDELRAVANKKLTGPNDSAGSVTIEDGQLLRRMIAKRCIYGVDLNPLGVQLSLLSVWIHTFVPGLPLSLLDHNLVQGNSLIGVGSLDEIQNQFESGKGTMFAADPKKMLGKAVKPLHSLAKLLDKTVEEIEKGRDYYKEVRAKIIETEELCDFITAKQIDRQGFKGVGLENWEKGKKDPHYAEAVVKARKIVQPLDALHFPIVFPAAFLSEAQGFDVILGNPPWEKVKLEEHNFWSQHFPGIRGKGYEEKKKKLQGERLDLVAEYNAEKERNDKLRKILQATSAFNKGGGGGVIPIYINVFRGAFLM